MNVLVNMHHPHEGPGTLGEFLAEKGAAVKFCRLYDGDALPPEPDGLDLIVSMGGPMNVYQEGEHPWLAAETGFLAAALAKSVPTIGICLGSQLIAKAAGAKVSKNPAPEYGWLKVGLFEAGRGDRLFNRLPQEFTVLQWHEDTFDLPAGGFLLAGSTACRHQAFRLGCAYGLQFHLEVTYDLLKHWVETEEQKTQILDRFEDEAPQMERHAQAFYANLWDWLNDSGGRSLC